MLNWFIKKVVGTSNQREVKRLRPKVEKINEIEKSYQSLSDEQLTAKTAEFKQRVAQGESLDDILPEAFAAVKNACRRFTESKRVIQVRGQKVTWDMIPFDVQLIGGMVLHGGKIAEMATGEGKTLVATLPCYLNALTGKGVHVVTVNDYLAARDSEWMGEVYRFLGLTVGCIQHDQPPDLRRAQYACDIVYGTNSEYGFDYLRDNGMATTKQDQVQRGHPYAIVDEVDSILIDEARTPLIISGPATVSTHQYDKFKPLIERLVQAQNLECNRWAAEAKTLLDEGKKDDAGRLMFKVKLSIPRNKQLLKLLENPDHRRAMDDAELLLYQDLRRTELYKMKEEAYFTVEEKSSEADLSEKGRKYLNPNDPDTFVLPDLVTMFHDIDSNTMDSPEQKEKHRQAAQQKYDDASERIHNISQLLRAYCVFEKDVQYVVQENKVIIVDEFTGRLMAGRRWSDGLHQAVEAKEGVQIDRETQTLATITIQNYFRQYDKLAGMTGTAETEAHEFHDIYKLGVVAIPTNRPIARADNYDSIYKTRREKFNAIVREIKECHAQGQPMLVGTISVESSELISRMLKREGIIHNVLNAKYHQQEAEIVARAGQRGGVTIATNMAGRGTDIKLGEGVMFKVSCEAHPEPEKKKAGVKRYTLTDPKTGGSHTCDSDSAEATARGLEPNVTEVGGLYVIGTERHEARRIDRQLRGRCARQGDPGMSKFFISFEDDLMRNFGDSRKISSMMTRLGMKDDEELQHPWLNRSVETAQKRVEERNYSIRKHTLQYDDVMNQQRAVIYTYRNDILTTEDPRKEIFDVVEEVVNEETQLRLVGPEADPEGYVNWLNNTFPLGLKKTDFNFNDEPDKIAAFALQKIRDAYALKVKFELPQALQAIERYIVLGAIDRLWQEHLYAMDGLRSSIHLRSIGQKDPLIEYKQEAFVMFEDMMGRIQREIVNGVFRSSSSIFAFEKFLAALPQKLIKEVLPSAIGGASGPAAAQTIAAQVGAEKKESAEPALPPVRRTGPKLGRNDPCPFDPAKKFKNCCGALGEKTCIKNPM